MIALLVLAAEVAVAGVPHPAPAPPAEFVPLTSEERATFEKSDLATRDGRKIPPLGFIWRPKVPKKPPLVAPSFGKITASVAPHDHHGDSITAYYLQGMWMGEIVIWSTIEPVDGVLLSADLLQVFFHLEGTNWLVGGTIPLASPACPVRPLLAKETTIEMARPLHARLAPAGYELELAQVETTRGLAAFKAGAIAEADAWFALALDASKDEERFFNAARTASLTGDTARALAHLRDLKELDSTESRKFLARARKDKALAAARAAPGWKDLAGGK